MAEDDEVTVRVLDEDESELESEETVEQGDQIPEFGDDDKNILKALLTNEKGVQFVRKLTNELIGEFDTGWESTKDYRERFAEDWLVLAGHLPPKEGAFEFCANEHIPIALENISRLALRAFGEVFGDRQNVMRVHKLDPDDQTADKLTTHGNWQLRVQIPDFYRQMHRAVLAFFFIGDCTMHSYYDESRRENRHELLTPDEFVVPFAHHTTMPDYSDVPWRAKIIRMYDHEFDGYRDIWVNIDEALKHKASSDDEPEQPAADALAETQGQEAHTETKYAPHKVILWEGWKSLPYRNRVMFIQAYIHYNSKKMLSLKVHEEAPWQEKERYRRQIAERDKYAEMKAAHDQMVADIEQQHAQVDMSDQVSDAVAETGLVKDETVLAGMNANANAREQIPEPPPPPPPPSWMVEPFDPMQEPPAMRRQPIHLFAHGVCLEPLVGNLGLSFGSMQADHNRAADTIISQYIDTATMANIKDYITAPGVELPDVIARQPGAVHKMQGTMGGKIGDEVMPIESGPANEQMVNAVRFIQEVAQSSVQASDILSGEPGKSGETYRGVAARIEQATKQLSVVTGKFVDFVTQVLRNNAKLNAIFLDDNEVIQITEKMMSPDGSPMAPGTLEVGRAMYERNYSVEITADLRFATSIQKISEADEMVQLVMSSPATPLLMQYPDLALKVIQKAFRARGEYELAQMVSQPPPIPQTPQPGLPPGAPPEGAPPAGPPQ